MSQLTIYSCERIGDFLRIYAQAVERAKGLPLLTATDRLLRRADLTRDLPPNAQILVRCAQQVASVHKQQTAFALEIVEDTTFPGFYKPQVFLVRYERGMEAVVFYRHNSGAEVVATTIHGVYDHRATPAGAFAGFRDEWRKAVEKSSNLSGDLKDALGFSDLRHAERERATLSAEVERAKETATAELAVVSPRASAPTAAPRTARRL